MSATKRGALAVLASVSMVACAHGGLVGGPGDPPGETSPPSEETVTRWNEAANVFARLDREGRWDGAACHEALSAFERVRDLHGSYRARGLYMAGLISMRCGNTEGARSLYTRALEIDGSLCEARVSLALMDVERGDRNAARSALEAAIARNAQCASAYLNLAILQSEVPAQSDEALANLRRALAIQADYMPALDRMALIYLARGEEEARFLDLAQVVCRQAQLIDPSYAPIYNTWGLIDVERGELTSATAKFARAMELDPSLFEAHMNFAQITLSQRAYEDAARAFARARELSPTSYDAAIGLGVAQRGLSNPEQAERMYRAALEIDQQRPEAFFDLAVLYQQHRGGSASDLTQALAFLEDFVQRARGNPRFSTTVAEVVRWCDEPSTRRGRRRASTCQRGRAQNIVDALALMNAAPATRPSWAR